MSPEIIADALAFLERVQLVGKEVPAFNWVIKWLFSYREELLAKNKTTDKSSNKSTDK